MLFTILYIDGPVVVNVCVILVSCGQFLIGNHTTSSFLYYLAGNKYNLSWLYSYKAVSSSFVIWTYICHQLWNRYFITVNTREDVRKMYRRNECISPFVSKEWMSLLNVIYAFLCFFVKYLYVFIVIKIITQCWLLYFFFDIFTYYVCLFCSRIVVNIMEFDAIATQVEV